jgi:hypothetical protein
MQKQLAKFGQDLEDEDEETRKQKKRKRASKHHSSSSSQINFGQSQQAGQDANQWSVYQEPVEEEEEMLKAIRRFKRHSSRSSLAAEKTAKRHKGLENLQERLTSEGSLFVSEISDPFATESRRSAQHSSETSMCLSPRSFGPGQSALGLVPPSETTKEKVTRRGEKLMFNKAQKKGLKTKEKKNEKATVKDDEDTVMSEPEDSLMLSETEDDENTAMSEHEDSLMLSEMEDDENTATSEPEDSHIPEEEEETDDENTAMSEPEDSHVPLNADTHYETRYIAGLPEAGFTRSGRKYDVGGSR